MPSLTPTPGTAAWSHSPTDASSEEIAAAEASCVERAREQLGADLEPLVSDVRGRLLLTHMSDAHHSFFCYSEGAKVVAAHGGYDDTPEPPVASDSLRGTTGAIYPHRGVWHRDTSGRLGSDVVGVVLDTVAQGEVRATVTDGHFAAWWPVPDDAELNNNTGPGEELRGVRVELRDGSVRDVPVREYIADLYE